MPKNDPDRFTAYPEDTARKPPAARTSYAEPAFEAISSPGNLHANSETWVRLLSIIGAMRKLRNDIISEAYQAQQARPDLHHLYAKTDRLELAKCLAVAQGTLLRDIRRKAKERHIELPPEYREL